MHRLLSVRASVILVLFWAFAQPANAEPIFSIEATYSDIMPTSGGGESVKFTLSQGVVTKPLGIGPSISNLVIEFETGMLTSVQTDEIDPTELIIGTDAVFDLSFLTPKYDPKNHFIEAGLVVLKLADSPDFDPLFLAAFRVEFLSGFTFTPDTGVPNWDTEKEDVSARADIFIPEPLSASLWMVIGGLALWGCHRRRRNSLANAHRAG